MGKKKFKKTKKAVFEKFRQKYTSPKVSVFIAMPSYKGMTSFTYVCLDKTKAYMMDRGIPVINYGPWGNSHVDNARNKCVEKFLETSFSYLMWIDDDMIWDQDAIEKMIMHDVDVVSAIVTKRQPPFTPTMYTITKPGKKSKYKLDYATNAIPFGSYPLDRPFYFPNSGIGTAFMLVKRHVLEEMEHPFFCSPPTERGTIRGEDFFFCLKMGAMGYKILYDPTIRVYHLGMTPFGIEDHIAFMQAEKEEEKDLCQYTNINANNVEDFKRSFAGPHPQMISAVAPVAAKRYEELVLKAQSESVEEEHTASSEREDQTNPPTKTGIEADN